MEKVEVTNKGISTSNLSISIQGLEVPLDSEVKSKPLISPRLAVPNPTKKPSKRNSFEGNLLSLFSNQNSSKSDNEDIKNFVELTITNVCLVDFPNFEK